MTPYEKIKAKKYKKTNVYVMIFLLLICILGIFFGIFSNNTKRISETFNYKTEVVPEPNVDEQIPLNTLKLPEQEPKVEVIKYKEEPPQVDAKAFGVFYRDGLTGEFNDFYLKNENQKLPPASITKLMTSIIALDKYSLNKEVLIPSECANINASNIGFRTYDTYKLEDLLYGVLVRSAADAVCAITRIEGSANFVKEMNEKAKEYGMENTVFQNAIGLDAGMSHVSTIRDLEILATKALDSSIIRKITGTKYYEMHPLNSGTVYKIVNTNDLLTTIPGTIGLKTGLTSEAGECLVYVYEENGREIMIILLGSNDRFGNTTKILEWAQKQLGDQTKNESREGITPPIVTSEPEYIQPSSTSNPQKTQQLMN